MATAFAVVAIWIHRLGIARGNPHRLLALMCAVLRPADLPTLTFDRLSGADIEVVLEVRRAIYANQCADLEGPDGRACVDALQFVGAGWRKYFGSRHPLKGWSAVTAWLATGLLALSSAYLGLVQAGVVDFTGPKPRFILVGWSTLVATSTLAGWGLLALWILAGSLAVMLCAMAWRATHEGYVNGKLKAAMVLSTLPGLAGGADLLVLATVIVVNLIIWVAIIFTLGALLYGAVRTQTQVKESAR